MVWYSMYSHPLSGQHVNFVFLVSTCACVILGASMRVFRDSAFYSIRNDEHVTLVSVRACEHVTYHTVYCNN